MLSRVLGFFGILLFACPSFATPPGRVPPPSPNASPKAPPTRSIPPSPRAPVSLPWAPRADCSGSYGTKDTGEHKDVQLSDLMKNPKAYEGQKIRVKAPIKDVCSRKGCWMVLSDGKNLMRVRFKGYKFFVPTNSKGYLATVEGKAREGVISEAMARHYAEESANPEDAKKIHGPQKAISFMAHWVFLERPVLKK